MKDITSDKNLQKVLTDLQFVNPSNTYYRAFFDDLVDFFRNRISNKQYLGASSASSIATVSRAQALTWAHDYLGLLGRGSRYWAKGRSLRPAKLEYPRDSLWISQKISELLLHLHQNYPELLLVPQHNGSEDDRRADLRLSTTTPSPIKISETRSLLIPAKRRAPPHSGSEMVLDSDDAASDSGDGVNQGGLLPLASTQPPQTRSIPIRPIPTQFRSSRSVSSHSTTQQSIHVSSESPRRSKRERRTIRHHNMVDTVEAVGQLEETPELILMNVRPRVNKITDVPANKGEQSIPVIQIDDDHRFSGNVERKEGQPEVDPGFDVEKVLERAYQRFLEIDPQWVKARSQSHGNEVIMLK